MAFPASFKDSNRPNPLGVGKTSNLVVTTVPNPLLVLGVRLVHLVGIIMERKLVQLGQSTLNAPLGGVLNYQRTATGYSPSRMIEGVTSTLLRLPIINISCLLA